MEYKSSMEYGIYHLEVVQRNDSFVWAVIVGTLIVALYIIMKVKKYNKT